MKNSNFFRSLLWISRYSLSNFIRKLYYSRTDLEIESPATFLSKGTSISDSSRFSGFVALCDLASKNDLIFKNFRRYRIFKKVVDFVRVEQGFLYMNEITKLNKGLRLTQTQIYALQKVDSIGNPAKFTFRTIGNHSPNSVKYLKVYFDLRNIFGDLSKFRIVEIGVGFGGQAIIINLLNRPSNYSLYDVPEVLHLNKKVISRLNLEGNFQYLNGREPNFLESDLLISNDAFSELSRPVQEEYLVKVILKAKRGYITWNAWSEEHLGGYSLAELLRLIPGSQVLPEVPLTFPRNSIIVWGFEQKLPNTFIYTL